MKEEEAEKPAEKAVQEVLSGGDQDDLGPEGLMDAAEDAYVETMAKCSDVDEFEGILRFQDLCDGASQGAQEFDSAV